MSHAEEVKQPKYVDFAEYILFQVRRTQSLIRQADLWQLLITSVCGISFLMLLWILLDHWAFSAGLSAPLRWLGFFSLVGSLAYAAYVYYRDGGRRNVTSLYAAKTLETSQQDFQNSLFTLMDLDYHGKPTSSYIRGSLEKRAALTLNNLDVEEAIDRQALLHRLYALIAVVVVLFGYASLGPKSSLDSILRVLLPWTTSTAPTQTRLVNILPGSAVVTTGAHVEVSVYVEGKVPDNVWLKYATADRRIVDEQVSLTESGDDLGKYTGVITGENGRGIDQTTTYWIEAGDARSSEYVLTIKPAPVAVINSLVITPPAYTERPPYRQTEGTIDALEGSQVTLTAQTNIPVEKAWIQLYEADDPASRSGQLPLEIVDQTRLEGNWKLQISDEGTYPHYYSIECESAEGARDPAPPRHPILIRPDERPEVKLVYPVSDMTRPINLPLPVIFEAFDPDFRLSGVSVIVEKQGQMLFSELVDAQGQKSLQHTQPIDFERLPVIPGESISVFVEVRDNREPRPNRRQSPKVRITLAEPQTPQKLAEEQIKEEQEIEKQQQAPEQQMQQEEPGQQEQLEQQPMPEAEPNADKPAAEEEPAQEAQDPQKVMEPSENGTPAEQGEQDNSARKQKQDGDNSENNADTPQEPGDKEQGKPQFSPEGEDDDLVLEKLIKKLQEQNEQQKPEAEKGKQQDQGEEGKQQPSADGQMPPKNPESDPDNAPTPQPKDGADPGKMPDSGTQPDSPMKENPEGSGKSEDMPESKQPAQNPGDKSDMPGEKNSNSTDNTTNPPGENPAPADNESMKKSEGEPGKAADKMPNKTEPGTEPGDGNEPGETKPGETSGETMPKQPGKEGTNTDSTKEPGDQPRMEDSKTDQPQSRDNNRPAEDSEKGSESRPQKPGETPPNKDGQMKPGSDPNNPTQPGNNQDQPQPNSPNSKPNDSQNPQDSQKGKPKPGDPAQSGKSPSQQQPPSDSESMKPDAPESESQPKGTESQPASDKPANKPSLDEQKSPGKEPGKNATSPDTPPEKEPSDQPDADKMAPDGEMPPNQQGPEGSQEQQPNQAPKNSPPSQKPGDQKSKQPGEGKSNQPGSGKGGQEGQPGKGEGKGEAGKKSGSPAGEGGGSPRTGPADGSKTDKTQPGNAQGGKGMNQERVEQGGGTDDGNGDSAPASDAQSLEDRRKAAELVLQKIEEDLKRGKVDPELLEELNWNEDNLKQFQQRLAEYLQKDAETPAAQDKQRQFEEMLKTMKIEGERNSRFGSEGGEASPDEFAPALAPAPPEYRELEEAFRRSLNRGSAKPSGKKGAAKK